MIREKGDRRSLGTLIPRLARNLPATGNTLTFVEISNSVSPTAPHRSREGTMSDESIKEKVKEKYGKAALRVTGGGASCCGSAPSRGECDPITSNLYAGGETAGLPAEAVAASLPLRFTWEYRNPDWYQA